MQEKMRKQISEVLGVLRAKTEEEGLRRRKGRDYPGRKSGVDHGCITEGPIAGVPAGFRCALFPGLVLFRSTDPHTRGEAGW